MRSTVAMAAGAVALSALVGVGGGFWLGRQLENAQAISPRKSTAYVPQKGAFEFFVRRLA